MSTKLNRQTWATATCSAFAVGAWFTMTYGNKRSKFYIAEVSGDIYRINCKKWPSSLGVWLTRKEMEASHHQLEYIGQGKPNMLAKFFGWTEIVHPFREPNAYLLDREH